MSRYKLNISFSDKALHSIYKAGQRLALIKMVQGNAGRLVTWVTTLPFESNIVEWQNDYMLYSSKQEELNGATITKLSEVSATDGFIYDFTSGSFGNAHADEAVGANQYAVCNKMSQYPDLSFGLAVTAKVNGQERKANPINAVPLLYMHTAVMSPIEKVGVFLAANIDDGMVQTREFSNTIIVEYQGEEIEHSVRYDESKGIFVSAD